MECLVQVGRPIPDVAAEFQMSAEQTVGGASLFCDGGFYVTSHFTLVLPLMMYWTLKLDQNKPSSLKGFLLECLDRRKKNNYIQCSTTRRLLQQGDA